MLESGAMGSNGHGHLQQIVDAPRPLKAAELSSQQRNVLVDELVATVNTNARALTELRRAFDAHVRAWQLVQREQSARLDAHANVLLRARFRDRLRWVLFGQ